MIFYATRSTDVQSRLPQRGQNLAAIDTADRQIGLSQRRRNITGVGSDIEG